MTCMPVCFTALFVFLGVAPMYSKAVEINYSDEGFSPSVNAAAAKPPKSEGCVDVLMVDTRAGGQTYAELLAAYLKPIEFSNQGYQHGNEGFYAPGSFYGEGEGEGEVGGLSMSDPDNLEFNWLKNASRRFLKGFYWNTAADRGVFYDALISKRRRVMATSAGIHPSEVFGVQTMKDYKRLSRFFDEMPNENFRLTPDMLNEAHGIGNRSQKIFQQVFSRGPLSWLAGYLFQPGKFKKRRNQLSLMRGVSERQLRVLNGKLDELIGLGVLKRVNKQNRKDYELSVLTVAGKKFREPKLHTDGKYRGWYLYPSPRIVSEAVADICDWANLQMKRHNDRQEGAFDPLFIAVVVKQALYYIHPWVDGNGRVGRATRDKILEVYGLLPILRIQHYHDIDLTIQEDYNLAKMGVLRRLQQLQASGMNDSPRSAGNKLHLDIAGEGAFTNGLRYLQPTASTSPSYGLNEVFLFGHVRNKQFIFNKNGFFQDYTGVQYTLKPGSLRENNPTLVPIPDQNLVLFSMGGEVLKTTESWMRHESPYHWSAMRENLSLAIQYRDGALSGDEVKLVPYRHIYEANNAGIPQFEKWDMNFVAYSLTIKEDPEQDPLSVLNPFRGGVISGSDAIISDVATPFESWVSSQSDRYDHQHIFAQAGRLDIFYRKMQRHIRKKNPSWDGYISPKIEESRRKIHAAVRKLLASSFELLPALFESSFEEQSVIKDKDAWVYLRQEVGLAGFYHHMRFTHFWYADYDEGIRNINPARVVVSRNATIERTENFGGLIPEASVGEVTRDYLGFIESTAKQVMAEMNRSSRTKTEFDVSKIEGRFSKRLARWIISHEKRKEKLQRFVSQYLVSPYVNRGLEIEFEREFYLMSLHWNDSPPKQGVSTTTRPSLVWKNSGPTYADNTNGNSAIFVLSIPIDSAMVGFASRYGDEYEITVRRPVVNFFGTNPSLVLYRSQHEEKHQARQKISVEEAKEKGVDMLDINYLVFDGEVPEEAKYFLRRRSYFPNGEPYDIDHMPWDDGGYHMIEGGPDYIGD